MQTRVVGVVLAVVSAAAASPAWSQIAPVTQERMVRTDAMVSSGGSSSDFDEAASFGPFVRTINSPVAGAGGAGANATATQNSALGASLVTGTLIAHADARTGSTFITGDANAESSLLFIFNLAAPTPIEFTATAQLAYLGRNPEGEPSDLSGVAGARLLNADTLELIAGLQLFDEPGSDSDLFTGTLPAGQYVILARAQMHCFSADLLGPPARSGAGDAAATFALRVVPGPGAAGLLGMGMMFVGRRRR